MAPEKCRGSHAIIMKWSEKDYQTASPKGICPACGKAVETYAIGRGGAAAKEHGTD